MRWRRARQRTTWRDFARLGVVFLALAACSLVYHSSGIVFNHTGSMPVGFYQVRRTVESRPESMPQATALAHELGPGTVVMWCLPERLVGEAQRRGYLGGGTCPGGVEPILKEIAALPGDTVVVDSLGMAVNGRRLSHSRPLPRDSRGRPLDSMPWSRYVVRPGEAWLWSPYAAHSYDSRYYGALPFVGLVGVARPLWIRHLSRPGGTAASAGGRR